MIFYPISSVNTSKVFVSLVMQIIIGIIACLALACLEIWPSRKERNGRSHSHALATALVEFHKNQCYFISAIEIAALVLGRKVLLTFKSNTETPQILDLLLSIPLSMNGFIPTTFTLTGIARYGRLSWHIIALSTLTIALSTGSLATVSAVALQTAEPNLSITYEGSIAQEYEGSICGSKSPMRQNTIDKHRIFLPLVWVIYSNCIVWALGCLIIHITNRYPKNIYLRRVLNFRKKLLLSSKTHSALICVLFLLVWAVSFGYHIYLYSFFVKHNLVSRVWSLGQIIAVTAWAPSIVEFFYIESSKLAKLHHLLKLFDLL